MDGKANQSTVDQWVREATPDQVIATARNVLARVSTLDERYREQFTREIGASPQIAKLMKHPLEQA